MSVKALVVGCESDSRGGGLGDGGRGGGVGEINKW